MAPSTMTPLPLFLLDAQSSSTKNLVPENHGIFVANMASVPVFLSNTTVAKKPLTPKPKPSSSQTRLKSAITPSLNPLSLLLTASYMASTISPVLLRMHHPSPVMLNSRPSHPFATSSTSGGVIHHQRLHRLAAYLHLPLHLPLQFHRHYILSLFLPLLFFCSLHDHLHMCHLQGCSLAHLHPSHHQGWQFSSLLTILVHLPLRHHQGWCTNPSHIVHALVDFLPTL